MTKEELIKNQFPNDEFLQSAVLQIVDKCIAEIEKENANLKDEWQEQVQKATDEGYARTLQTIQLSKAKEIIKTLADDLSMYSGNYQKELLEAEQFLKDEPKSKWVNPARTTNDNQIKLSEV